MYNLYYDNKRSVLLLYFTFYRPSVEDNGSSVSICSSPGLLYLIDSGVKKQRVTCRLNKCFYSETSEEFKFKLAGRRGITVSSDAGIHHLRSNFDSSRCV